VVPVFLAAARDGTPAPVNGDGGNTRDFTYIENVVHANLLAAEAPAAVASGWPINIGAGQRTSLLGLLDAVRSASGRSLAVEHRPGREGDVRDSLASLERALALLGYRPTVGLEEGLRRTWEWFCRGPAVQ
jgi:UDP-N-acetylglucosamine 4-epimerase